MTLAMVFTFAATYIPSSYTNSPSTSQSQLDTLSHVKVKKTDYTNDEKPIETSLDLATPENIAIDTAIYDEKQGFYRVGTRLGDNFLSAPYIMTPEEYLIWNQRKYINR